MLGDDVTPIKKAEDTTPRRGNLSGKGPEAGEFGTVEGRIGTERLSVRTGWVCIPLKPMLNSESSYVRRGSVLDKLSSSI
jgi:hypothetical protein